jgi:transposase
VGQPRILVTRRPKYGCCACAGAVVQAPAPERLIRAGLPTEAMVAHVLVGKYAWHLPLYRQAQILLAQGIEIDRSTLAFWVGYAAAELTPLWRRREILLGSPRLFVDETRIPVLDPGRGRTKTGYFWSIARDDSAWQGGHGAASRCLHLRSGARRRACDQFARRLLRHRAVRRRRLSSGRA